MPVKNRHHSMPGCHSTRERSRQRFPRCRGRVMSRYLPRYSAAPGNLLRRGFTVAVAKRKPFPRENFTPRASIWLRSERNLTLRLHCRLATSDPGGRSFYALRFLHHFKIIELTYATNARRSKLLKTQPMKTATLVFFHSRQFRCKQRKTRKI